MAKRTVNKSAFVRGLPNLPASAVVAKAKAQGIVLTDKYVYNIRAKAKARSGSAVGRPGRPKGSAKGKGKSNGSAQEAFITAALDIGIARAEELLGRLRDSIRRVAIG